MDGIGEAANWSEVVRPAILSEVATHEHRKGANMTTVVERLKASKEKYLQEAERLGFEAGRAWASNTAEYAELLRVAKHWEQSNSDTGLSTLRQLVDPDEILSADEFYDHVGCKGFEESDEFAEAFVRGAAEIYEDVEAEMDKQAAAKRAAKVTGRRERPMPFFLIHRFNPKQPHEVRKQPFGTEPEAVIHACALIMANAEGDFLVEDDMGNVVTNDQEIRNRCKATRTP
jgi:hypothetical protein